MSIDKINLFSNSEKNVKSNQVKTEKQEDNSLFSEENKYKFLGKCLDGIVNSVLADDKNEPQKTPKEEPKKEDEGLLKSLGNILLEGASEILADKIEKEVDDFLQGIKEGAEKQDKG